MDPKEYLLPVKFGIVPVFVVISAVKVEYCCSYDSINEAILTDNYVTLYFFSPNNKNVS